MKPVPSTREIMANQPATSDQELFALVVGDVQRLFVKYLERQGPAYVEEGLGRFALGEFQLQCVVLIGARAHLTCHAIDVNGGRHSLFEIATEASSDSQSRDCH